MYKHKKGHNKQKVMLPMLIMGLAVAIIHNNQVFADVELQSTTFSAQVESKCTIVSASTISFGSYTSVTTNEIAPQDGTGTIQLKCNKGGTGTISLNNGANFDSSKRRLKNGTANYLIYDLYTTSDRTTLWTASTEKSFGPASSGATFTETVYSRIPGGQDVFAGSYTDTVQLTITY